MFFQYKRRAAELFISSLCDGESYSRSAAINCQTRLFQTLTGVTDELMHCKRRRHISNEFEWCEGCTMAVRGWLKNQAYLVSTATC